VRGWAVDVELVGEFGGTVALGCGGGRGVWGILVVLRYADLPQVRAWRACAQPGLAGVLAVRKPESVMPVLLSEISAGQKARAVPASGLWVSCVFAAE
jgi:hypothetical protein